MSRDTDVFIKGSDNIITQTLTEDAEAISVSWTQISVVIGSVTITRTSNGNGISFSSGVLEITPGSLTEDLSALIVGRLYPVKIAVESATDTSGVVYGDQDSDNQLYFLIAENPA